jgi:hypothetical protein
MAAASHILCINLDYLHNPSVLPSSDENDGEYGPEFRLKRA